MKPIGWMFLVVGLCSAPVIRAAGQPVPAAAPMSVAGGAV
jgi:hypothetical protein